MTFAQFIETNLDAIMVEWESFARAMLPAAASMSGLALRDHGREILQAIVKDMAMPQSAGDRSAKSRRMHVPEGSPETVAAAHGALRQLAGFDLVQLVAEFRALRASVLELWRRSEVSIEVSEAIEEIARFNEGIDQALAESVERYSTELTTGREMFLAMLGHDLRGPLWVIDGSSQILGTPGVPDEARAMAVARITRSSKSMSRLITDLLTYSQSRLGRGIPVERSSCDLGQSCLEAIDSIRTSHPDVVFEHSLSGDLRLDGDPVRLEQVLMNLLSNAVQHGARGQPVRLSATSEDDWLVLVVQNAGQAIPKASLPYIFEPLVQIDSPGEDKPERWKTSLGLGLFIVREIVQAHQGTIDVESSSEAGTAFRVRIPRRAPALDHSS